MKPTTRTTCAPSLRLLALGISSLCTVVEAADTGQKAQANTQSIRAVSENVAKQGQDFHVLFIRPGTISRGVAPGPVTRTLAVDFETYAPSRKIKAAAQYSNGRVVTRLQCGTFAVAGRHSCDIELPNIGSDVSSITIGMASARADAPSGVYETALTFPVPVARAETVKQISPAARQLHDAQQARPERVEVKRIRSAADLPPMLREGDAQALNPQPIPPGRNVLTPKNPGDPSPVVRTGDNQALNPQPIPPGRAELHPVVPGRGETKPNKNPGDPPPYTRSENTLYRVEVHSNESPGEPAPLRLGSGAASTAPIVTAKAGQPPGPMPAGGGMETATNRSGGDYANRDLPTAEQCQAACAGEAQCKAWTWVKSGVQGPQAKCWLKNAVPVASRNDCCTSGVK